VSKWKHGGQWEAEKNFTGIIVFLLPDLLGGLTFYPPLSPRKYTQINEEPQRWKEHYVANEIK
jgi:hypothetical protein